MDDKPNFLKAVEKPSMVMQPDQIHTTADEQKIIAETDWKRLKPLLQTK